MSASAFAGFEAISLQTGETSIFLQHGGSGPALLLLHGFPQTHLMWRDIAPRLARNFTVVCADLRGYGQSGCPASATDHAPEGPLALWRAWADDVTGQAIDGGHFFPEAAPQHTAEWLAAFFRRSA